MVIQNACGFLSGRGHRRDSQRQQSEAQLRTAAVKRREAFIRANVGLSRAIGTTIIVSPLDMAGQPGACIVTAVLQAGLAIVEQQRTEKPRSRQRSIQRFVQIETWGLPQ